MQFHSFSMYTAAFFLSILFDHCWFNIRLLFSIIIISFDNFFVLFCFGFGYFYIHTDFCGLCYIMCEIGIENEQIYTTYLDIWMGFVGIIFRVGIYSVALSIQHVAPFFMMMMMMTIVVVVVYYW